MAPTTASSQPGAKARSSLDAHEDLAAGHLEGRVDAAMGHLALGGLEGDRRHVATQVVAGDVGHDVFGVLGGQHDDLDIVAGRLVQTMQRSAQRPDAVGRHDGDADCGARPVEPAKRLAGQGAHEAAARLGGQAPVVSSSPIRPTSRSAAAASGADSRSPKVSTSSASAV